VQRIFVYEYITGGGTLADDLRQVPTGSLLREGTAMVAALAEDFLRLPGTEVVLLRDARLQDLPLPDCCHVSVGNADEEQQAVSDWARSADWTVLIAPEIEGALLRRCRWVEASGGRLLSPSSAFIACAADKARTATELHRHGIPVPDGVSLEPGSSLPRDFPYPGILKPVDGCGSIGVQWIASADDPYDASSLGTAARLERFCPGLAASVAVVCGPGCRMALPPCRQRLSEDGRFRYLGGESPLEESLSRRATKLAIAAVECLPPTVGYIGVDLVLGPAADGSRDVVIEVNPRLTTSYVGLRRLLRNNLAEVMLQVAAGRTPELSLACRSVTFDNEGHVACNTLHQTSLTRL
jgi:predicted ATP-grasp superfamily ATP-dependent carboligase